MAATEFYPTDGQPCQLDVLPKLLGHRKRQNGVVGSVALKNRETLAVWQASEPFLFGDETAREQCQARKRNVRMEDQVGGEHGSLRKSTQNE